MGWVLRMFQSRERSLMLILLKSLVIPLPEYCFQLWNPWKAIDIQAIEAIQRTFTYKITEVLHLNYWKRLHKLKLCSLQWRRERYIIIYIWKITQYMVPNIDGTMGAINILQPWLYNSLPKYLRDIEIVKTEKLKFELDKFLELIPDPPKMPNYVTASGSNSILDQLSHLWAQGI